MTENDLCLQMSIEIKCSLWYNDYMNKKSIHSDSEGGSIFLKSVLKDLWIHIVLIFISLFFICKFSSAPQIFDALGFLLEKPSDGTFQYEVFRILENLSLAYLASLIFYLIVDYIPKKREEKHTEKVLEKNLTTLYMHMDKVCAYFDFTFEIDNLLKISEEQKKVIDDFCFPGREELLMVQHTKSDVCSGEPHVESFDAKQEIISAGKGILNTIKDIDDILERNRANMDFVSLINEIRTSDFLEKMTKIFPSPHIVVEGKIVECRYLNFYSDLVGFYKLKLKLQRYKFTKLGVKFRTATQDEINEWIQYQINIRKEHPEIQEIFSQLNATSTVENKEAQKTEKDGEKGKKGVYAQNKKYIINIYCCCKRRKKIIKSLSKEKRFLLKNNINKK